MFAWSGVGGPGGRGSIGCLPLQLAYLLHVADPQFMRALIRVQECWASEHLFVPSRVLALVDKRKVLLDASRC